MRESCELTATTSYKKYNFSAVTAYYTQLTSEMRESFSCRDKKTLQEFSCQHIFTPIRNNIRMLYKSNVNVYPGSAENTLYHEDTVSYIT